MYKEDILDMYNNPRNVGELDTDYSAEGENPSCGDSTEIFVEVQGGEIKDIKHQTEGCAVSTAGISIVSDELIGKTVEEVKDFDKDWMIDKLGIDVSPMRMKCALLGLKTVQKSIDKS